VGKVKDKEMEKLIDACYDVMFQRQAEMEELGLLNYGDSSYYIQNPDEYEKDKRICKLENEVERLKRRLSNCIEPKFKVGQKVWFVNKRNGYDAKVECAKIENLRIFALKSKIQINYRICDSNCSWYDRHSYRQKELFATEEEAKNHLEEMKNG
jgi:hypothetical protein